MTRSRGRTGSWSSRMLLVVVVALLAVAGGLGTSGFTTGGVDRTSAVDVASDTSGTYGIDTASAVHTNATGPLVTLTNRLGSDVTVTVTLQSESTDIGDLVVDGTGHGTQVTFSLAAGDSHRIDIAIPDDESLVGRSVYFHAEATADGLYVSAENRTVTVES